MNILHLKYAVEVAKTYSINKAAKNLFMAQPNLSRAIKELEESLGITIFNRTTKGMVVTTQGEDFLRYAKRIIAQIDEVEAIYKHGKGDKQSFSISVPCSSYISYAFAEFVKNIDSTKQAEIFYKETSPIRAIKNILNADYKLGIIRFEESNNKYFKTMLEEKGLAYETIAEFSLVIIMNKNHPLARNVEIDILDLTPYIEISQADPLVSSLPFSEIKNDEIAETNEKSIFVFDRASQFDLLSKVPETFMWASPIPSELLEKYGLVQRACNSNVKVYKDILIYQEEYVLSELDNLFIAEVRKSKSKHL